MKTKLFSLLALVITACNGAPQAAQDAGTTSTVSSATTSSIAPAPSEAPAIVTEPTPAPTATPAPSATPSPTTKMFNVAETDQTAYSICMAFENFNAETTIIQLNYTGYFYSFSASGVTVAYLTGPDNGQTYSVETQTTISIGAIFAAGCSLSIHNGILLSVVPNQ